MFKTHFINRLLSKSINFPNSYTFTWNQSFRIRSCGQIFLKFLHIHSKCTFPSYSVNLTMSHLTCDIGPICLSPTLPHKFLSFPCSQFHLFLAHSFFGSYYLTFTDKYLLTLLLEYLTWWYWTLSRLCIVCIGLCGAWHHFVIINC